MNYQKLCEQPSIEPHLSKSHYRRDNMNDEEVTKQYSDLDNGR